MAQRLHYGSLEFQERQRVTDNLSQISSLSTRAPTVIQQQESMPFIEYSTESLDRASKQQEEQEKKQKMLAEQRRLIVPTQVADIKSQLRQLGQPVTFFGESAAERRDRLKQLLSDHLSKYGRLPQFMSRQSQQYSANLENEFFMYEGQEALRSCRIDIAKYSLHKASLRVEKQRFRRLTVNALDEDQQALDALSVVQEFQIQMAQFADAAGVSRGTLSPNEEHFATAGGSGECKIYNLANANLESSLLGHLTKCHSVAFHPQSTVGLSGQSFANIATASADLSIRLWQFDLEQKEVEEFGKLQTSIILKGHEDRVNQVMFHQNGKNLISLGYDKTWRLWDLETQQELLVQSGHSRGLYSGVLHPDGSLLFTGDLGGFGMIWDLRTGKGILPLIGHVKGILSCDFSQNGHHLATGGDDNNIRIWDIRRKSGMERIPAHIKLISDLQFQKTDSKFLVSASYDGSVKFWNARDWSLSKVYQTQDNKVYYLYHQITSVNMTKNDKTMITTGLDKKLVIWY